MTRSRWGETPQAPCRRRSSWKRHLALAALVAAPVLAGSLTGGGLALAAPPGAPASGAEVQKATDMFHKATELFKKKNLAPALEYFRQSYALVPSPNSHLYIARCLAGLGNTRSAWLEFDRTVDEANAGGAKYAPTRDSAVQERDELTSRLALVTVAVPGGDPATTVRVGSYDVPADRWGKPYPVEPGTVEVLVQVPGQPGLRQSVTVNAGERRDVSPSAAGGAIVVPPGGGATPPGGEGPVAPTSSRRLNGLQIGGIVAGAVGVAGFIMFGVEGAASKSTYNSLQTACNSKPGCAGVTGAARANADSLISTGNQQKAIANAGIALGVIGVAAGVTLFVLGSRKTPADSVSQAPPSAQLVVGPTWAGARGTF